MSNSSTVVKKNFVWSSVLTASGYLFPLITFPYVSRVLGVAGIGRYQFACSIISYFNIIAMMGIATIGIREIAKAKGERGQLSQAFSSLITLNLLSTSIAVFLLIICLCVVSSFHEVKGMLLLGIANIFCNTFVIEWLFKGLEDFRYITIRGLLIRSVYVGCVLIFVRDADDCIIYFLLTTLVVVANSIINIIYSRKYVDFSYKKIHIKPYIKPFLILGIYQILTAMYLSFNVIFLGSKCGDIEVGYYSTATKLYGLIMSFFTAFAGVMLPRMSSLIEYGEKEEFGRLSSKSIDFLLLFSIPIIVITEVYAPVIINLMAGPGYEGAILPMRIVMPLMLIIGYEQIVVIQMLTPLRKDNAILINSVVGASIALLLNFTIVPKYGCVGSAIVWCCSELSVLLSAQKYIQRYSDFKIPFTKIFASLIVVFPSVLLCLFVNNYIDSQFLQILIGSTIVIVYFFLTEMYILKNELLLNNVNWAFKRILCKTKKL